MTLGVVKIVFDVVSAISALSAALAWFKAAKAPLPVGSFPDWKDSNAIRAALVSYQQFLGGAVWNRRAALLAGVSALFGALSLIITLFSN